MCIRDRVNVSERIFRVEELETLPACTTPRTSTINRLEERGVQRGSASQIVFERTTVKVLSSIKHLSAYRLFRAHVYHLELNRSTDGFVQWKLSQVLRAATINKRKNLKKKRKKSSFQVSSQSIRKTGNSSKKPQEKKRKETKKEKRARSHFALQKLIKPLRRFNIFVVTCTSTDWKIMSQWYKRYNYVKMSRITPFFETVAREICNHKIGFGECYSKVSYMSHGHVLGWISEITD